MRQVDVEKEKKNGKMKVDLIPVITLVIYYGKRKWNSPLDIYSRLNINGILRELVSNYKIHLLSPLELADEDINKYVKNIKFLFTYLKYSDEKEEIKDKIAHNKEYERIDNDIVDAVNILIDSKIEYSMEEEEVDMCKAIRDIRDEGIQEGAKRTMENNIKTMNNNGATIETIAKLLNLDVNYVKTVLAK